MNPLFIAHIIGDFLLQPKWMVDMKQRGFRGIFVHATVHAIVMLALIFPKNIAVLLCIIGIAAVHGLIDQLKINYGKRHSPFSIPFLLDQVMHLLVLMLASAFFPFTNAFWIGEMGQQVLGILFFFSFILAWWNLSSIQVEDNQNTLALIKRFALISVTFAMFAIPALMFLKPIYS